MLGSSLEFPSVSGNISSETIFAINTFKTNEDPMAKQGVGVGLAGWGNVYLFVPSDKVLLLRIKIYLSLDVQMVLNVLTFLC